MGASRRTIWAAARQLTGATVLVAASLSALTGCTLMEQGEEIGQTAEALTITVTNNSFESDSAATCGYGEFTLPASWTVATCDGDDHMYNYPITYSGSHGSKVFHQWNATGTIVSIDSVPITGINPNDSVTVTVAVGKDYYTHAGIRLIEYSSSNCTTGYLTNTSKNLDNWGSGCSPAGDPSGCWAMTDRVWTTNVGSSTNCAKLRLENYDAAWVAWDNVRISTTPAVVCGDGTCNGSETCSSCPTDCGTCVSCGDGTCNGSETCSTCPSDCGTCGGGDALYFDDFEGGLGNWSNVAGDNSDWTRDYGGTPSSSTGPSSGAGGSTYYVYTESSSPNYPSKSFYLESPTFAGGGEISFYWHMYGASMGSLHLDVWTGSSWQLDRWQRSGNYGNTWVQQTVSLAPYSGQQIKLRFRGVTGSSYTGDMALDNIAISGGSTPETFTSVSSVDFGDSWSNVTMWSVTGPAGKYYTKWNRRTDCTAGPYANWVADPSRTCVQLDSSESDSMVASNSAQALACDYILLGEWTQMATFYDSWSDCNLDANGRDTATANLVYYDDMSSGCPAPGVLTAAAAASYTESCEPGWCGDSSCNGGETCATCPSDCFCVSCGDGSCNGDETCASCEQDCGACSGGSTLFSDDFESGFGNWSNVAGDDADWSRDSGGTPSTSTGPSSGAGGSAYYVYTESSSPNYPSKSFHLESPTFTGGGEIGFYWHMYGSSMGSLQLEVWNGSSWSQVWGRSGDNGSVWVAQTVSLAPYARQQIKLRFRGVSGSSYRSDMALDNITITSGDGGGGDPPPTGTCGDDVCNLDETCQDCPGDCGVCQVIPVRYTGRDVFVGAERLAGGASEYQIVYRVNMDRLRNSEPATSSDPYWWQFYRNHWDANGNFNTMYEQELTYQSSPWLGCPNPNHEMELSYQTVGVEHKNDSIPLLCPVDAVGDLAYGFRYDARWYLTLQSAHSIEKNTNGIAYYHYVPHYRGKIVEDSGVVWIPLMNSLGTYYWNTDDTLQRVWHDFRIELNQQVQLDPGGFDRYPSTADLWVWAGEVRPDGFAIVPQLNYVHGVQWIFVVPDDADVGYCGSPGYPVGTGNPPCIFDPPLWSPQFSEAEILCEQVGCNPSDICDGACDTDEEQEKLMAAYQEYGVGLGGNSKPDFDRAGETTIVYPDGTQETVSLAKAKELIRTGKIQDVHSNGSMNSYDAAIHNTEYLASARGRPILLVYYAQGWCYICINPYISQTEAVWAELLAQADTSGRDVNWSCHSHSCGPMMNKVQPYENQPMLMFGPASDPLWENWMYHDIENANSPVEVVRGGSDWLSEHAGEVPPGTPVHMNAGQGHSFKDNVCAHFDSCGSGS